MSSRAEQFHSNPWLGVFYITGGGSPLLSELLSTPGASSTVLEACVPYAFAALTELLGRAPEQAASTTTARQLAATAYARARKLDAAEHDKSPATNLFGFGCTAALGTNRVKRGTHRAHWAIQTATDSYCFEATFNSNRDQEEAKLLDLFWASLELALPNNGATAQPQNFNTIKLGAHVTAQHAHAGEHYQALLGDKKFRVCRGDHDGKLLLPGSFNPIHEGHRQMLKIAEEITQHSGAFELTVKNADKPSLDFLSLEERLANIDNTPVWLTNTPNFADKAILFPSCTFALGVDTLQRIGDLRFYQDDPNILESAMQTFQQQDTHFLVFGRINNDHFITLADLTLPETLLDRCRPVPQNVYRNDISSSAIRQARQED